MSLSVPLIRVRPKNQVTLPREVVEFLHVHPLEHIEYQITSEGVLIRSVEQKKKASNKLAKLMSLSKPNRTAYGSGSVQEIDDFINSLRD
jgi:hypothetical protein